jgi:phosphoadenosine phosphosulfate reductase
MLVETHIDGYVRDKVAIAIDRLRAFEPEEGYYLAFSGGKDSQCIYHLAVEAGVKFEAHYNVTGIDPPELVQFIRTNYIDVIRHMPKSHLLG